MLFVIAYFQGINVLTRWLYRIKPIYVFSIFVYIVVVRYYPCKKNGDILEFRIINDFISALIFAQMGKFHVFLFMYYTA